MTPRVPSAEEQIDFLANIQTLLDEGQFVFVLVDAGCNWRKSDLLADVPFLERWLRRDGDAKGELASRSTAIHAPQDLDVSRQGPGWAYAQVEQTGGQVWEGGRSYRTLGGDWRAIMGT